LRQLLDRLEEAAAADRAQPPARLRQLRRRGLAIAPGEPVGGQRERTRVRFGQRRLLVPEDDRREQVQEPVLIGANRVGEAGGATSSTTLSARGSSPSSATREAGQTNRASMNAAASTRARRSSASASRRDMLAGGNSGAWSIRRARSASLASVISRIYRFPRSSCSRSIAWNSALKLPAPKPREPWRSISSRKTVGRSPIGRVKIWSR